MKKLLALILCVMMFVAIIPTAAFADVTVVPAQSGNGWRMGTKQWAKDAVDDATDAISDMYNALAANKGVFATVSAIDGVVVAMAKDLWADKDGFGDLDNDAAETHTKNLLRSLIGSEITKYMNDHANAYASLNDDGTVDIDPAKYLKTFATAASKAMTSEKATANIQAVVLSLAAAQAYKDFSDDMDDLLDEIIDWNDGKGTAVWGRYFGQDIAQDPLGIYAIFEPAVIGEDGAAVAGIDFGDNVNNYIGLFVSAS